MKNWINKIPKDKLQRYIFLGALILVFAAFFISLALIDNDDEPPIDENPPGQNDEDEDDDDDDDDDEDDIIEESFKIPTNDDYEIVRKFYDIEADMEENELAIHIFNNIYSNSKGVSIASKNEDSFEVVASLTGVVEKVEENALRGYIVTIKHDDDIHTQYSSLSSVNVAEGDVVEQGELVGISGISEYDELNSHVHFKVLKKNMCYNPETLIGKKITDLN